MQNPTLLQFFHWYYPDGSKLWPEVADRAAWLSEIGITMAWLPPCYKGDSGGYSVGYDSYDLFDLGEFDQKGVLPPNMATNSSYWRQQKPCAVTTLGCCWMWC